MIIKIEIDVKPEELRRFLGLPDVGGLQEDMVHYLRDKVATSVDGFDPAQFVKDNIQGSRAWKTLMNLAASPELEEEAPKKKPTRRRSSSTSSTRRKPTTKK
ncbi:MAG: DUF6489 family protein [Salinisphaeraceae bacterium]|nr:DUF6489 family protein [Salinisphaeraceae bacterium]